MRLFIQELWTKNYSWEQSFEDDQDLMKKWEMLKEEYEISQQAILPRSTCNADKADLHVFCDASKNIYGAAVYIVPIHYNTKPQLVLAKAKIIGINKEPKVDTIPKLELMAILIGANIANYCLDALFSIEIESLYLWSDSRTALSWCSSYDIKEQFVSNRVRQIRNLAPKAKLMYVESARNSADILTRQPKAKDLLQNNCWWNGPEFLLKSRTQWPIQNPEYNLMPEETMKTNENLTTSGEKMLDLIKLSKASKNLKEKETWEN